MLRSSEFPVQTTTAWAATRWALAVGLAALLVVFASTWATMAKGWTNSETYGHGMAVVPIAVWLIWRQRAQLAELTPSISWIGVIGLSLCCLGWLAAELAGINVVAQFALTGMVVCLALALTGWGVAKAMAFPLLFLFFMVPAGEFFNPPLMEGTANATVWALQASGIPVYREGMNFALPTGRWSVVEACSGLRYVLASAMLGALFAYLNFERWVQRIAFFGVSIAVAVVANWMRAYLIVLLGHFTHMKWGVGDDHVIYGWIFFGITMFVLFWMGAIWRDSAAVRRVDLARPNAVDIGNTGMKTLQSSRTAMGMRLAVLASVLACFVLTHLVLSNLRDVTPWKDFEARAIQSIGGLSLGSIELQPNFSGSRASVQGVLDSAHGTEVYLAYFARQASGAEMIVYGNSVMPDSEKGWQIISRTNRATTQDDKLVTVLEWRLRRGDQERLLWTWYTVGGIPITSAYKAKALTAWFMLTGKGDHSVVTVVSTLIRSQHDRTSTRNDENSFEQARGRLSAAVAKLYPLLSR